MNLKFRRLRTVHVEHPTDPGFAVCELGPYSKYISNKQPKVVDAPATCLFCLGHSYEQS